MYGDYLRGNHRRMHKWLQYFPIYEHHFERFRNRHVTLIEIGIGEGGSLQQWRSFLGPFATIVGVDINPLCKQVEEQDVHVRIGSQDDPDFLRSVLAEFPNPDIVIDDGSHLQHHISTTFDTMFSSVAKNGVYLVEDLHTAYWPDHGGGLRVPGSFIERAKGFVDQMHAEHQFAAYTGHASPRTEIGDRTTSIHFYDSVVVMEVGEYRTKRNGMTGDVKLWDPDWVPPPPPPPPPAPLARPASLDFVPQPVMDRISFMQDYIRDLEQKVAQQAPVSAPPLVVPDPALQRRVSELEAALSTVRESTSWKLTAPLRALGGLLRK